MKKKSKVAGKSTTIPSPFEFDVKKTERTAVAILMYWMREIIEKENINLGFPDVDTIGKDIKLPDIVIYESKKSQKVLCVIEAKPPYFDIFNEEDLKKPAWEKAVNRKAKYFCTTNFKILLWYDTEKVNKMLPEEEQIIQKYFLSEIENLDRIEETKYSESIKRALKDFLLELYFVHSGKKTEPKLPIDEFLVFRIQEKIKVLSVYYRKIIEDNCHKDPSFAKKLINWFSEQGWSFSWQENDFEKASRQTAYLLVNKILFYNLLQAKRQYELDPLEIPQDLTKGSLLGKTLQAYFDEVLKIDYETIYTTDFIDTLAFPEEREVVKEIKELVNVLKRYNFSQIGFDIIGRIFEKLIPQEERHILGQYFTNPDIVDLILKFCLHHEEEKILDPSCGAGTFLVRAYQHKKIMNQRLTHEKILETLWGVDIAKFPAHLSTINLAINDLSSEKNYPNIINEDFFKLLVSSEGFELPESWRKARSFTLGKEKKEVVYPRWFDVIVGNPPYTRQEEIQEIGIEKKKLIENAIKDIHGRKIANISKRAGIYTYFFIHGTKFLKEGGYFGFIVSNAWLDVDYGRGLQEFFLNNYKIVVIIESKVERWFEDADINTCIVILQKCKEKKERNENLVKFVYLKKPLRYFISPAQDIWEKQVERLNAIEKLKKTILAHNELYENEELRIYPKKQKDLWDEGFDFDEKKYVGSKWGKYLRAPEIFFKILEKGKGKLISLKYFAIFAGYIHDNNVGSKFPKAKIIMSSQYISKINIYSKDKYVKECGVRKDGSSRLIADLLIPRTFDDTFFVINNVDGILFKRFYKVILKKRYKKIKEKICLVLNSTLQILFWEIIGIIEGLGALNVYKNDFSLILVPKLPLLKNLSPSYFQKFMERPIGTVFEELGANTPEDVSLDKIKPDRRELDKIIMCDILGLTEQEQLEVYRAVIDLVKSRIEKAKSVKKRNIMEGIDIEEIKSIIVDRIKEKYENYR